MNLIQAAVPYDGGGPSHFALKLNGKDLYKFREYKSFGEMNESFSFSLNDRITSTLVVQLCRDNFSVTNVLATTMLSLDKIQINIRQELNLKFPEAPQMALKISYYFESAEISKNDNKYGSDYSLEKIGRRSTNRTYRPSAFSKRSSLSRQNSYLSQ